MPITPDTKDWTWVLERACPECGFDASGLRAAEVAAGVRANAHAWRAALGVYPDPRMRPSDERWSPLEYACHVRDVYALARERMARMLAEDGPTFANWDQDAKAVDDRYDEQDPDTVLTALEATGDGFAADLEAVRSDQWGRTGIRSDGAFFTVESFARYIIHDPVHHLHDIAPTQPHPLNW